MIDPVAPTPRANLVMRALADPTRMAIYERIARRGESSVVDLTDFARVSQPAVSQHLRALADADLVAARREGRKTFYRALPHGLAPLSTWIGQLEAIWEQRLDRFEAYLHTVQRNEKHRDR